MKIVIVGLTLVNCVFFLGCQAGGISGSRAKTTHADNAYGLAKKFYHRGQYDKAIEYFEKYIDENADNTMYEIALYYLSKSYKNTQDYSNALLNYQKLIDNKGDAFWIDLAKADMEEINLNR